MIDLPVPPRCSSSFLVRLLSTVRFLPIATTKQDNSSNNHEQARPATLSVLSVSVVTKRSLSTSPSVAPRYILICTSKKKNGKEASVILTTYLFRLRKFSSVASRSRSTNSASATSPRLATSVSVSASTSISVSSTTLPSVSTVWTSTPA